MKTNLLLTLSVLLLINPQSWARVSVNQYKSGLFETPIESVDLNRKVRAKHSIKNLKQILPNIKRDIKQAATAFSIDPILIIGAIAGEHAMNVGLFDSYQEYRLQKTRKKDAWVNRTSDSELGNLLKTQHYNTCHNKRSDAQFWYCVTNAWNKKKVGGVINSLYPQNKVYRAFTNEFFSPNGLGSTFGLGQMSPLRALMVSDLVKSKTHLPRLSFRRDGNSSSAFESILDPNKVVYYIAATIKLSIETYKSIARFDISTNPGVTSTLYQNGNEIYYANKRYRANIKSIKANGTLSPPRPNKLGKWVLQNQKMLRDLIR